MRKGTILQPTYIPWLGYFEMIDATDKFIVYDDVQFVRKSWHHRNKILGSSGEIMLSVPCKKAHRETKINEIEISYDHGNPIEKHLCSIELSYCNSPFFEECMPIVEKLFEPRYNSLLELNMAIIKKVCNQLKITTSIYLSSELRGEERTGDKSADVVELCKKADIDYLYDANGAKEFLNKDVFRDNNIEIVFQKYKCEQYNQMWGKEFRAYLSIFDLIFNIGFEKSLEVIRQGRL